MDSLFTATFILELEWYDERIIWKDLNTDTNINIPSKKEKSDIWCPNLLFPYARNMKGIPNDGEAKFLVRLESSYQMSSLEDKRETAFFCGSENPLIYSRKFTLTSKCDFNLALFPFDTQTCSISLDVGDSIKKFVELKGTNINFVGEKKLATFYVIDCQVAEDDDKGRKADFQVKILLKRQISQYLFEVYMPSIFIMIIAQVKIPLFLCKPRCTL